MASKNSAPLIIFLTFNILFFTLTTACGGGCSSIPKPKPKPTPTPSSSGSCPRKTLKLGVCANVQSWNWFSSVMLCCSSFFFLSML
ncbi:unnamed protein product [Brassica oleracea var. botrytis]